MARPKNTTEFEIKVDGEPYIWRLQRGPQWSNNPIERRGKAQIRRAAPEGFADTDLTRHARHPIRHRGRLGSSVARQTRARSGR